MSLNIDSSSLFTYFLFLIMLGALVYTISRIVQRKMNVNDIKINPLAPVFGLLFVIALWLGDLTTLSLSTTGMGTMLGMNPVSSSRVPALFIWCVVIFGMFFINYFFLRISERRENKKLYSFNKLLVYTQLLGLIAYTIFALAMALFGYGSTFVGFYLLNLYHSTLPLIILTTFILSIDIK